MKLEMRQYGRKNWLYITLTNKHVRNIENDDSIAENLGLKYNEYVKLIEENKGFECSQGLFFINKNDCKRAIENLEPYLIMQTLMGEVEEEETWEY